MSVPETVRLLTSPRSQNGAIPPTARRRRDSVRRLRGSGLPRGLARHVGPDADAYREYLVPMLRHLGLWPLPDFALDAARQAGLAMLTLRRLEADLETLQGRTGPGRRRQAELRLEGRIRKQLVAKRLCERDLARLAKRAKPQTLADAIKQRQGRESSA